MIKKKILEENIKTITNSVVKERAALLAKSIHQAKNMGVMVEPFEPIEGKMFWK